jgi:predicted Zn-dependent protease with MMP-like domain
MIPGMSTIDAYLAMQEHAKQLEIELATAKRVIDDLMWGDAAEILGSHPGRKLGERPTGK